ncbi:BON domain-containing protein [Dyella lipolytica]|nr:BON domain-containing protein [Dyella lipolytica]GLQ45989.1 BON domain-containing protein [Dyella lipolytica]
MKSPITLSALTLTTLLSLGGVVASHAAVQNPPADDSSMGSNQPVTDSWITTKVKAELASTDGVKSMDVSVTTINGVVTLTGVLANDIAVQKAVAVAQSVKGVKKVDASGLRSKD